jgi:hypothetical protein
MRNCLDTLLEAPSSSATEPVCAKAFFIGDNRASVNWGRGASIALRQLLADTFEINGCVAGDLFNLSEAEVGYVGTFMPPKYHRLFRHLLQRRRRRPFAWYIKFEELFGAKDFVAEEPAATVDNLLANKHRYPVLARVYNKAKEADILVVDGDGDIIFSTPPRRQTLFLLAMIELGIRLGKPVFLVNSMISDCLLPGDCSRNAGPSLCVIRNLWSTSGRKCPRRSPH